MKEKKKGRFGNKEIGKILGAIGCGVCSNLFLIFFRIHLFKDVFMC